MSVDPDDRTPLAIKNACMEVVTYGAPVLPGAMFMLAYCEKKGRQIPVMGLPGCVMYAKRTILIWFFRGLCVMKSCMKKISASWTGRTLSVLSGFFKNCVWKKEE